MIVIKKLVIQAILTYKYSDNILRTKVTTVYYDYLRPVQYKAKKLKNRILVRLKNG